MATVVNAVQDLDLKVNYEWGKLYEWIRVDEWKDVCKVEGWEVVRWMNERMCIGKKLINDKYIRKIKRIVTCCEKKDWDTDKI